MKYILPLFLITILLLFPCSSVYTKQIPRALPISITTEDIIELSQAGVSDEVIISQIKATQSVFYLTNEEIIQLKGSGVSDDVINFMVETSLNIPRAELVEPPVSIRYYYYCDPWYDYWWGDPWYDNWRWRRRRWRRRWWY